MKRILIILLALMTVSAAAAEERWVLCKPGAQVMIRRTPEKDGIIDGFMEAGDVFRTDGKVRNGFIRAEAGDGGTGWIYLGFVADEKPADVAERYVCVARRRVAVRRWCGGPKVSGRPWLKNGENVTVYYRTGEWSVTDRGYIASEWLEADPE